MKLVMDFEFEMKQNYKNRMPQDSKLMEDPDFEQTVPNTGGIIII